VLQLTDATCTVARGELDAARAARDAALALLPAGDAPASVTELVVLLDKACRRA
jgi:hypothetical protein